MSAMVGAVTGDSHRDGRGSQVRVGGPPAKPHPLRPPRETAEAVTVDDNPLLTRIRAICLALPGAQEKTSHGRPVFYTTKTFCWWGAHPHRDDLARGMEPDALAQAFSFLPDPQERDALLADGRFHVPAYLGARGWLSLDVRGHLGGPVDWAEVGELIDASYRNTAGKRLIAQLDAR